MGSLSQSKPSNDEEACTAAIQLAFMPILPVALKTAIELQVLEIIANAGPGAHLSPTHIASLLPTKNPNAPALLDRILRLLASFSIVTCSLVMSAGGQIERSYGLGGVCKYLVKNQDGVSMAPLLLLVQENAFRDSWNYLKEAVLEGGVPFEKVHEMSAYEYSNMDPRFNNAFNKGMSDPTSIIMEKILECYDGFHNIKELMDVGGGVGTSLNIIISKYHYIKGINFDLPHVIAHAPSYPGVEHVGGDMFAHIPRAETIYIKWVLPDLSDERCVQLLRNCYKALPEFGKVIIVDSVACESPEKSVAATNVFLLDLLICMYNPDGKERTQREFEELAKLAGFASMKLVCCVCNYTVMELYKV